MVITKAGSSSPVSKSTSKKILDGVIGKKRKERANRTKVKDSTRKNDKSLLEEWKIKIQPENWPCGKVMYSKSFNDVIENLNKKLEGNAKTLFRSTCFGYFLDVHSISLQPQLIHQMLLREVYQPNREEMWFDIGGQKLKFGIEEFALITGLPCHGNADKSRFENGQNRLKNLYFNEDCKVTRPVVAERFNNTVYSSDEEAMKMGLLYFITNFLYTKVDINAIDEIDIEMVDSGDYTKYPWGKDLFNMTLRSLCHALSGKEEKSKDSKKKATKSYKLAGFPLAFQIWIYESIPGVANSYAKREGHRCPRILNWSTTLGGIKYAELERNIFGPGKIKVNKIVPTEEERNIPYLKGFFARSKDVVKEAIDGKIIEDDDDDFEEPSFRVPSSKTSTESNTNSVNALESSVRNLKDQQEKIVKDLAALRNYVDLKFGAIMGVLFELQEKMGCNVEKRNENFGVYDEGQCDNVCNDNNDDLQGKDMKNENYNDKENDSVLETSMDGKNLVDMVTKGTNIEKEQNPVDMVTTGTKIEEEQKTLVPHFTEDTIDEVFEGVSEEVLADLDKSIEHYFKDNKEKCVKVVDQEVSAVGPLVVVPFIGSIDKPVEVTTKIGKRDKKLGPPCKSPFTNEKPKKAVEKRIVRNLCPFGMDIFDEPQFNLMCEYDRWYDKGLKLKNKKKKFVDEEKRIRPAFKFGITEISDKMWFYSLHNLNEFLDDTHIDVVMYYLRKKIKVHDEIKLKVTTTDTVFAQNMDSLYKQFLESGRDYSLINLNHLVANYVLGKYMLCNTPWIDVDEVLMPINVKERKHWILVRFVIKSRKLLVYNSLRGNTEDKYALNAVQPLSELLPKLLDIVGFYGGRNDIDFSLGAYANKKSSDSIDVIMINGLPQQVDSDCGIFVIKFAECLIHGKISQCPTDFSVDLFRHKLCVDLYSYARKKQLEDYDTESEESERPKKKKKN